MINFFWWNNDLTAISSVIISIVLVPITVWLWQLFWSHIAISKKIEGLLIDARLGKMGISDAPLDAIIFTIKNNTGSKLYISTAFIEKNSKKFKISDKSFGDGSYELKFRLLDPVQTIEYKDGEIRMETGSSCETALALSDISGLPKKFITSGFMWFKRYFVLRYTVIQGNKKVRVKTNFYK